MTTIQAIILGIIQGFAEPIPVSSSAQTKIAAFLMGVETPGIIFEVFLNFPSFLAILFLTRKDVIAIIRDFFMFIGTRKDAYKVNFKMALYIVVGTIPAMVVGFTMKDLIDAYFSGMTSIALFLTLTGAMLFVVRKRKGLRDFSQMTYKDALIIGAIQGTLAVIPGVSRSGATIVTALLLGLNRDTSFRFSFLLYLPIGFGSMLLGFGDLMASAHFKANTAQYGYMFVAGFFATIVGYKLFKSVVENGKLAVFTAYCWVVAGCLLFL